MVASPSSPPKYAFCPAFFPGTGGLAAGMDANATDKEGNTALMYEAAKGHTPILGTLLKAKAAVNKKNRAGSTALSWATSAGKPDSLRILLDKGANAEAINEGLRSSRC